jgi:hypothetical protein
VTSDSFNISITYRTSGSLTRKRLLLQLPVLFTFINLALRFLDDNGHTKINFLFRLKLIPYLSPTLMPYALKYSLLQRPDVTNEEWRLLGCYAMWLS